MLVFCFRGFQVRVDWSFLALVAALTSIEGEWAQTVGLCLCCAVLHELGHVAAMLWLAVPPDSLTLCAAGMLLPARRLACGRVGACVILLAGPAVNLCCAGLCGLAMGRCAFGDASLALGRFNLLPFEGSDGWQLLFELTGREPPRLVMALAALVSAALCCLAVWWGALPMPLIAVTSYMLASAVMQFD